MIQRILVVCIGNICRSPMAEGLLKKSLPEVKTCSAGIAAMVGHGADPIAVRIMADAGVDISSHRARMLTEALVRDADLILVMDDLQKQQISMQYPHTRGKVFRLAETEKRDVPDPYKQEPAVFHSVFSLIQNGVGEWVKRINRIG